MNDHITMYGREREPELDYSDVWENTYMNYICPEFFYHFFFCGVIFSLETEVDLFNISVDNKLPLRKRANFPQFPRRTCSAPLPNGRRTLHCLQIMPIRLPCPSHHNRNGTQTRQFQKNYKIRYRHDQMYLLWILSGGLSSRCHCRGNKRNYFRDLIMSSPLILMRNCFIINRNCWRMEISGSHSWLGILNILSIEDDFIFSY